VKPGPDLSMTESLARDLLDRTRAEITQADSKAAILLAGVLAVSGGIVAAIGGGKWAPDHQAWYVAVPFWAAAAAGLAAIACLAAAIYPRSRPHLSGRVTAVGYFADVAALDSPGQLRGLLSDPGTQLLDVWVDQIWRISAIANRKFQLLRWAVTLLGTALVLGMVAVAVAAIAGR
jgi:Family of unknown function (DUF5706)